MHCRIIVREACVVGGLSDLRQRRFERYEIDSTRQFLGAGASQHLRQARADSIERPNQWVP
jgi:hypothetical protein